MDDAQRKLKKAWKARERRRARKQFPLPDEVLGQLFAAVDAAVLQHGCDHTARHTDAWLDTKQIDRGPVITWLAEHGGYCDCEVVANAAEHWEENR